MGSELGLADSQLTDAKVRALVAHMRVSTTEVNKLNLNRNGLGDEAAIALAEFLKTNETLTYLSLHDNNIGDEGVCALADVLRTNNTLKSLFLTNNPRISRKAAMEVVEANESRSTPMSGLCGLVI
jgi:Ran GTPase-activating protein (RanGAP) involved in mRNA processing and transport